MRFRWNVLSSPPEQVHLLSEQLKVSPLVAHLLIQRGFANPDQALTFLNPKLEDLHDPYLMKGMSQVVERILCARDRKEKVLIYGDYDVDGITSIVILKRAFEMLGIPTEYHLPHRLQEGYGISRKVLERAHTDGCSLVVSVDNGMRAFEAAEVARKLGMDFIVTDHHLPDQSLPDVLAILNPQQADCSYPEKNLAAVGVVFKLIQALFRGTSRENVLQHFLKMVAIGTVADAVPITGENRVIVKFGLEGLSNPHNLGLQVLLQETGITGEVSSSDLAFKLAPRINAVTRMGGGREVVDLFSVGEKSQAQAIVREMNEKNLLRRHEEQCVLEEAGKKLSEDSDIGEKKFLVVAGQNWHRGVIGIVAARLAEKFYRPTLVLSIGEENCQGSGRSIPGFNLVEALDDCSDMFIQYGGHPQAVGCTLKLEGNGIEVIAELARRLDVFASEKLSADQLVPSLPIEWVLPPEKVSSLLHDQIQQLAPFGKGNSVPVFASQKMNITGGPWVLKTHHLKLKVQCNDSQVDAIWWKNANFADTIGDASQVDLAYTMERDRYKGQEKLLLGIQDLDLPGST